MQTIPDAELKNSVKKAGLRYVSSDAPGIKRQQTGEGFTYFDPAGHEITDTQTLERIAALVLPPAWKNVWICLHPEGHLQATGIDAKGRKQYRYHKAWNSLRTEKKFGRLYEFVRVMPQIRRQVETDLRHKEICKAKVLATVLNLMEKAFFRIGNTGYARQNGSYGLTTLRDRHVTVAGDKIRFAYRGKKGVWQEAELHDRRLARIVRQCREVPGQVLFQYYDEQGDSHAVDSGDINEYLQTISGKEFTAKDFRTWAATLLAFRELLYRPKPENDTEFRKTMTEVTKAVAARLGNTSAVCRHYYIHPALATACSDGSLVSFYHEHLHLRPDADSNESFEETLLEKFLGKLAEGKS